MKPITKTYIALAVAAVFAIGIIGGSVWSDHRIKLLERETDEAKQRANDIQQNAADMERAATEYKAKIAYLEAGIADLQKTTRKQDEQLEQKITDSRNARADVSRASRIRAIDTSVDELCKKLADAGHGCGESKE